MIYRMIGNPTLRHETQSGERINQPAAARVNQLRITIFKNDCLRLRNPARRREGRREKNIEQAKKQAALKKDVKPKADNKDKIAERIEKQLNEINQTFFAAVTDN